jgi:ribosomal protein S18 acetylase RimI-like enzyme
MALRPFRLSTDLRACAKVLPLAFQYPDNPSWSMQADEEEGLVGMLTSVARIWPVVKFIQFVFPALSDYVRGFVWEEKEQMIGMILLHRCGRTDSWEIARVAVLPNHRQRGIGRSLVEASLNLIRKRGGRVVVLDVTAGNVPACRLYEQLGFTVFEGKAAFDYKRNESPPDIPQPCGYAVSPIDPSSDWRCEYELAQRVIPGNIQEYQPVEETDFRPTLPERLAAQIARRAGGTREERIAVRTSPGERVIAVAGYSARTRPGGVDHIDILIDPAHAEIAPYLLRNLIRTTRCLSPGRRIAFTVPLWQDGVIEAAHAAGCVKRLEYHRMGMLP